MSPMNKQRVKSPQETMSVYSSNCEDNCTSIYDDPKWRDLNCDLYSHLDRNKAVILPREEFRSYTRPPIFEIYEGNVISFNTDLDKLLDSIAKFDKINLFLSSLKS